MAIYGSTTTILEEFPIPQSRMSLDFYLPHHSIAFEFQGRQHGEFVKHFHGTVEGLKRQLARDEQKKRWCEINDIRLIEVHETLTAEELRKLICQTTKNSDQQDS